jgi:hypothetical protein
MTVIVRTNLSGRTAPETYFRYRAYAPHCRVSNMRLLRGFSTTTATITVETGAGTRQFAVNPVYADVYPNGKACGGACGSATVTVYALQFGPRDPARQPFSSPQYASANYFAA